MENLLKTRKKIKPIARKRRNFVYLLFAILLGIIIGHLFLNFPPGYKLQLANFGIPILPIFFTLLGLMIFSATTFLFIQKNHGVVITLFVMGYFLMRMLGLTHWIFFVMIVFLLLTIELFIIKKK